VSLARRERRGVAQRIPVGAPQAPLRHFERAPVRMNVGQLDVGLLLS
jgi:hypothetical protein